MREKAPLTTPPVLLTNGAYTDFFNKIGHLGKFGPAQNGRDGAKRTRRFARYGTLQPTHR
ncbi:hypothetical protein SAMN04488115_102616 [Bosea lathyri]|uniref:Uncharacterized protein n=1 Tax=Bosea lathyri TaxID=1036778 RepID=A0A1H5WBL5_9HYPH|nr:hypothetical protein SAMN04488115_102616 [Bosea lathyri]